MSERITEAELQEAETVCLQALGMVAHERNVRPSDDAASDREEQLVRRAFAEVRRLRGLIVAASESKPVWDDEPVDEHQMIARIYRLLNERPLSLALDAEAEAIRGERATP